MPEFDYCFILNPAANGGLAGRKWPRLERLLKAADIDHDCYISEKKGHCIELVGAALTAGHTNLVAVGGDGTANEVLNGIFQSPLKNIANITLSVIPWGTGNDWASYYRFSPHLEDCVRLLRARSSTLQDIGMVSFVTSTGRASKHYFLNCVGTGFDSYLLEKMSTTRGRRLRYLFYALKCAFDFKATQLGLHINGETFERHALMLEICLGKYAGAGMQFAPEAIADDGLFDILLINDLSTLQIFGSLLYLYNGKIDSHWAVKRWRSGSVSIDAQTKQWFHCDGELIGQLPIRVDILPQTLRIIAPEGMPGSQLPEGN